MRDTGLKIAAALLTLVYSENEIHPEEKEFVAGFHLGL